MGLWQVWAGLGLLFIILEMTLPTMFFLNFAAGAFVTAVCTLYLQNTTALILIFVGVSLVSLLVLRPLLVKKADKSQETGLNAKYIGKTAKVVENITSNSGVISLYDERWEARIEGEGEIPAGADVQIVKNESLIMYVKEIK